MKKFIFIFTLFLVSFTGYGYCQKSYVLQVSNMLYGTGSTLESMKCINNPGWIKITSATSDTIYVEYHTKLITDEMMFSWENDEGWYTGYIIRDGKKAETAFKLDTIKDNIPILFIGIEGVKYVFKIESINN